MSEVACISYIYIYIFHFTNTDCKKLCFASLAPSVFVINAPTTITGFKVGYDRLGVYLVYLSFLYDTGNVCQLIFKELYFYVSNFHAHHKTHSLWQFCALVSKTESYAMATPVKVERSIKAAEAAAWLWRGDEPQNFLIELSTVVTITIIGFSVSLFFKAKLI